MSSKPRITIIGLGRVGGSLGLAIKKANSEIQVIGHDKDNRTGQAAQKRGAVDKHEWNLLNACDGAGLIVLAIPLAEIRDTFKHLSNELPPGVIVTDTAASKAPVMEWARTLLPAAHFIGGHPIIPPLRVDPVQSGIDAASADLFRNAVYCLTPGPEVDEKAVDVMTSFVSLVGAKPLFLDAGEHDGLVTGSDHLAYLLSAALLHTATTSSGWRDMSKLAGARFMQATELAAGSPKNQRELLLSNRQDLIRWIDQVALTLRDIRSALQDADSDRLDGMLEEMVQAREAWLRTEPGEGLPADIDEMRPSLTRMLVGGLASPRTGKRK